MRAPRDTPTTLSSLEAAFFAVMNERAFFEWLRTIPCVSAQVAWMKTLFSFLRMSFFFLVLMSCSLGEESTPGRFFPRVNWVQAILRHREDNLLHEE